MRSSSRLGKIVCLGVLFLVSAPAFADTITFPAIPSGVTLGYFTGGLTGPLGALPVTNATSLVFTGSAVPGGGTALQLNPISGVAMGLLVTFDSLQTTVSGIGNDFGGDPIRDNEIFHVTAFNAAGTVIGSASFQNVWAQPNLAPVSFTSLTNDIKYAAFTYTNDLGFYLVDNITFTSSAAPVPEPATLTLFGSALVGLAVFRRRSPRA